MNKAPRAFEIPAEKEVVHFDINWVITDHISNLRQWGKFLPFGEIREWGTFFEPWPTAEEYAEDDINYSAMHAMKGRSEALDRLFHAPRENNVTYVLICEPDRIQKMLDYRAKQLCLTEMLRARHDDPYTTLMMHEHIPSKATFLFSNSMVLTATHAREMRLSNRDEWRKLLNENHTAAERGWELRSPHDKGLLLN